MVVVVRFNSSLPYFRYINTTELVVGESKCCKTFVILVEVK